MIVGILVLLIIIGLIAWFGIIPFMLGWLWCRIFDKANVSDLGKIWAVGLTLNLPFTFIIGIIIFIITKTTVPLVNG